MMGVRRLRAMHGVLAAAFMVPSHARAQPAPLEHAHAHNDYEHPRPLLSALEHGFRSVEADVHLVDGRLLVAHDRDSVKADRTLESLYLEPLRLYIHQHGGRAYPGGGPLTLLIDVKSDSEATYLALHAVLRRYADILTIFSAHVSTIPGGDSAVTGPVTAVISGERAINTMQRATVRFAAVDGRLADLEKSPAMPVTLMPLISDSWDRITKWKGDGPAPATVRRDVGRAVSLAHEQGRQLRFWGTPDRVAVWRILRDAGVDLIGADDLDALRAFLASRRE